MIKIKRHNSVNYIYARVRVRKILQLIPRRGISIFSPVQRVSEARSAALGLDHKKEDPLTRGSSKNDDSVNLIDDPLARGSDFLFTKPRAAGLATLDLCTGLKIDIPLWGIQRHIFQTHLCLDDLVALGQILSVR